MRFFKPQSGYSLLELLVYIAIFSTLSILLIKSLVTSINVYAAAQSYRRVEAEGQLAMDRMVSEIRAATTITTAASTFNTNPGVLVLSGTDASGATTTVTFSVVNNQLQINDNGSVGTLTSTSVSVPSLIFRQITTTLGSAVKIELTLTTTVGRTLTTSLYDTAILRGK